MAGATTVVRRAPYKDFLQPALHRRFSTTASILLGIAYLEAILLANGDSFFWSWFPIGVAGIRTFFLFLCGVSIIILRIAQYHVGLRTSNYAFQTFAQNLLKIQTLEAVISYTFSSWLFSQVYLWSVGEDAQLGWISYYSGERPRLNEKAIFFASHFALLGLTQAFLHLFFDNDRLALGIVKARPSNTAQSQGDPATQVKKFLADLPQILAGSVTLSLAATGLSAVIYPLLLRSTVWHTALLFFRPFYSLPRTNMLPHAWPYNAYTLARCAFSGLLLSFMTMAGNAAFSIFLVKEPLKNGKPLTSESKDPNGSLLNGLKSKKLSIRCFALWELAFIARDYPDRRKTIYENIDRKDGPMWSQVYAICMDIVKGIDARIDAVTKPAAPAPAATSTALIPAEEKKRITQPLKEDPIFQATPQKKNFRAEVENAVSQAATSPGQPSRLSPMAKKAITGAKDKLLAIQREATGSDDPQSLYKELSLKALSSPFGYPFRQQFGRRLSTVVLGTPYGEPSLYVNAINGLTLLAVHSLQEDKYGNVQRDVASIIRTLTSVTAKLDKFRAEFPLHWTDVRKDKAAPEVDIVVEALKEGLGKLLEDFGPFARDLRLSLTDVRLAKEAVGAGQTAVTSAQSKDSPEMKQVH